MTRILKHPILDIPCNKETSFKYNGTVVKGMEGFTIAAALHQAGYPVHTHSLDNRNRSLECGIGKCGERARCSLTAWSGVYASPRLTV